MRLTGLALMAAIMTTGVAQAQTVLRVVPPGVVVASDIDGPYDDVGPRLPGPPRYAPRIYPPQGYAPPPGYGPSPYAPSAYGPPLLPLHEIYRVVREGGYSPLGAPQQRGAIYTIGVIDLNGEDGRLLIDARSGRILRFMPAYRDGARSVDDVTVVYGPPGAPPPLDISRPTSARTASAVPQARAPVPVPKPRTAAAPPLPEKSSAVGMRQPNAQVTIPPAPTAALAAAPPAEAGPVVPPVSKPAATLQPTQTMPPAQGAE